MNHTQKKKKTAGLDSILYTLSYPFNMIRDGFVCASILIIMLSAYHSRHRFILCISLCIAFSLYVAMCMWNQTLEQTERATENNKGADGIPHNASVCVCVREGQKEE